MEIDGAESVNVWPYVGYYILTVTVATIAFAVFLVFVPSMAESLGKASGFAINLASTMFASSKFIRHNGRLFNREEYWKIVSFSTLAACLFSAIQGFLVLEGGARPELSSLPPSALVGIMLFAGLLTFVLNILGYSSRFGKSFLKAELERRARTDAATFR
ncbi:MAG: hypothetical protein EOS32_07755 [Mesorhizobium sp.]|uniref:ABZJ_00895 family protein n=1 Tax=Mesorhizobium sp. TaxID=1871066 RepID=UPI000FE91570|nr:ABZJ_00895 family protein [Mesorhizobium sp.]RWC96615.1 MAG: hypothetical protein EOS32_07755 [Mesorhizobium sp.]